MAIPAAPLIAAGAGLLGNVANSLFSRGSDRRQQQDMLKFWRMNNQYNHPSSQMARLREAGLNPNMLYGQSVSGATGQSSAAPKAIKQTPLKLDNPIETYQNVASTRLQNDNLREQNTLLKQEQILKTLEARNKQQDNFKNSVTNARLDDMLKTQMDALKVSTRLKQRQAHMTSIEVDILEKIGDEKVNFFMQQLENAKKIGSLRDAEIRIKNQLEKFTSSNQAIGIISKLVNLIK